MSGCIWALQNSSVWYVCFASPVPPAVLLQVSRFNIIRIQVLPSTNVVFICRPTCADLADLMRLPKPKYKGSRHECNLVH